MKYNELVLLVEEMMSEAATDPVVIEAARGSKKKKTAPPQLSSEDLQEKAKQLLIQFFEAAKDNTVRADYLPDSRLGPAFKGAGIPQEAFFDAWDDLSGHLSSDPADTKLCMHTADDDAGTKWLRYYPKGNGCTDKDETPKSTEPGIPVLDIPTEEEHEEQMRAAKGGEKDNPNAGEVAEAFGAAAIAIRFINLPKTGVGTGEVTPAEILEFIKSPKLKLKTGLGKKNDSMALSGEFIVKNDQGIKDKIIVKIGIRDFSMRGLIEIVDGKKTGRLGRFVETDERARKALAGAANYANREVVQWAIGQFPQGGTEQEKVGWFINDVENTIVIGGIGTAAQSETKVDLTMKCLPGQACPLGVQDPTTDVDTGVEEVTHAAMSVKFGGGFAFGSATGETAANTVDALTEFFPELEISKEDQKDYNYLRQFFYHAPLSKRHKASGEASLLVAEQGNGKFGLVVGKAKEFVKTDDGEIETWPSEKAALAAISDKNKEFRKLLNGWYKNQVQTAAKKFAKKPKDFAKHMANMIVQHATKKEKGVEFLDFDGKDGYKLLSFIGIGGERKGSGKVGKLKLGVGGKSTEAGYYVYIYDAGPNGKDPFDKKKALFSIRPLYRVSGMQVKVEKQPGFEKILGKAKSEPQVYRGDKRKRKTTTIKEVSYKSLKEMIENLM